MTEPSVAHLRHLNDGPVISRAREVFRHQLRACASVRPLFFPATPPPPVPPADSRWLDDLAVALVCSSIATSSPYGLGQRVDERRCAKTWTEALDPNLSPGARRCGQALYEWAFPSYCVGDGISFANYLGTDATTWADGLADDVIGQRFVDDLGTRIEAADPRWSRDLDLILYKLARLAPDRQHATLQAWRQAFPGQPIDYTPPGYGCLAPSMFSDDSYLAAVIEALGSPQGATGTQARVDAVVSFLSGRARTLAVGNDAGSPASTGKRGFTGCFVPGTPVLVADGEMLIEVPIEQVGAGDAVVSGHGILSRCTAEPVQLPLLHEEPVYGINDEPPFVSAGHVFRTPDGWRAIDPETARGENPDRDVEPLREGDHVYAVERPCGPGGIDHRVVRVARITRHPLPAGSQLYGLHLDGDPSYHARGYWVAANYPVFTERRLAEGFSLLSTAERRLVRDALAPVMPLLALALGPFLEQPLYRALAGTSPRRPPTPRRGIDAPRAWRAGEPSRGAGAFSGVPR